MTTTTTTTTTLTIVTTPAVKSLIDELVASGTYASESDVLEDALRMLRDKQKQEREETVRDIREGIADADAGRVYSVEETFRRIEERNPYLKEK